MSYFWRIVFFAAFMWVMTWGIELAWNALVPSLFHGPAMTYQQAGSAYVLIIIVAAIFKVVDMKWS